MYFLDCLRSELRLFSACLHDIYRHARAPFEYFYLADGRKLALMKKIERFIIEQTLEFRHLFATAESEPDERLANRDDESVEVRYAVVPSSSSSSFIALGSYGTDGNIRSYAVRTR